MKLTIFSGITGFDKSKFIKNFTRRSLTHNGFSEKMDDDDSKSHILYIKFEDELLHETGAVDIANFLAKPSFPEKIRLIERAFQRVGKILTEYESDNVFLDIHLTCLYNSLFFPPIYAANLRELDPLSDSEIKVITLIDDVYNIWNNLKLREDKFPNTGLRLREILAWRSVELLQAEAVAFHYTTEERQVRNYIFAVRHPFVSLYNLIFTKDPICLYLSYPISNTRCHSDRVENINDFRKEMYQIATEKELVIFDPVTIDELALNFAKKEDECYILTESERWPIETEQLVTEPKWPIKIPENEVTEAMNDIKNNVKPRDFKLIDNSIFTTVYRKNFGGESRGVVDEIRYANSRGKRVYVYDPADDGKDEEPHPFDQDVYGSREIEEFYGSIKKGIDYYKERFK